MSQRSKAPRPMQPYEKMLENISKKITAQPRMKIAAGIAWEMEGDG